MSTSCALNWYFSQHTTEALWDVWPYRKHYEWLPSWCAMVFRCRKNADQLFKDEQDYSPPGKVRLLGGYYKNAPMRGTYFLCFAYLILLIFASSIHLPLPTALPTSINYIAVSVDLICFRIYLFIFFIDLKLLKVYIFFFFYWLCWHASISTATCGARGLRINCRIIKYCCCSFWWFQRKSTDVTSQNTSPMPNQVLIIVYCTGINFGTLILIPAV